MKRSISSGVMSALFIASREDDSRAFTASLKTSFPFIFRKWDLFFMLSSLGGMRDPPPGIYNSSHSSPFAPRHVDRIPGVSDADMTAAPAPSPKRMQVDLS